MAHYVIQCHDGNLVMEEDTFDAMRVYIPYFNALRNYKTSQTIEWLPPYVDHTTRTLFSRDLLRKLFTVVQFGCIKSLLTSDLFDLSDSLGGVIGLERWDWRETTRYTLFLEDQREREREWAALDSYSDTSLEKVDCMEILNLDKKTTYPDYIEIYSYRRTESMDREPFLSTSYVIDQVGMLPIYPLLKTYHKELWMAGEILMRMLNGIRWTEHHLFLTTTRERAHRILDDIYETLKSKIIHMIRTQTHIIFYMRNGAPYIVELTLYPDIQYVLLNTGVDCFALATDGTTIMSLPRCTRSLIHNCIVLDPRFSSQSYSHSVADVWSKGVHVVCPGYTSNWDKYIPSCTTKSPGLAGIMACMNHNLDKKRISLIGMETINIIADEIECVHGTEKKVLYLEMENTEHMEIAQEQFLKKYPVRIPLIVTTYWPDITNNKAGMTSQWAGVFFNLHIPPTTLSSNIEFMEPVRVVREDDFYRHLMCFE